MTQLRTKYRTRVKDRYLYGDTPAALHRKVEQYATANNISLTHYIKEPYESRVHDAPYIPPKPIAAKWSNASLTLPFGGWATEAYLFIMLIHGLKMTDEQKRYLSLLIKLDNGQTVRVRFK